MAVLSFEQEYELARNSTPFANGHEGVSWTSAWCENCRHDINDDCTLLGVSLLGKTPRQWEMFQRGSLTRKYICREFGRRTPE